MLLDGWRRNLIQLWHWTTESFITAAVQFSLYCGLQWDKVIFNK
jgi:hypothetical protein